MVSDDAAVISSMVGTSRGSMARRKTGGVGGKPAGNACRSDPRLRQAVAVEGNL
ncbi:hypothetical protein ALISP_5505 [Alicycliphilus sp. B1]|nr:hypothetical protein ALISP_5505 [Alicycliphilus sp. B1]